MDIHIHIRARHFSALCREFGGYYVLCHRERVYNVVRLRVYLIW